jgi:hypothetical protein
MKHLKIILLLFPICVAMVAQAQSLTVSGIVYDISGNRPIEAVMVNSTHAKTLTDSLGRYLIRIGVKDSIWFSLFGKQTPKYALDTVADPYNFNIMIHVVDYDLPEVRVRNNYYKFDSIQNRIDYAKYFNYQPPGIKFAKAPYGFGSSGLNIGFDLDEILNMFRFQRSKNLDFLENRMVAQERDKYVDYRFTKRFVQKITHLEGEALQKFMNYCRPTYEALGLLNDLELGQYIQRKYALYKRKRAIVIQP